MPRPRVRRLKAISLSERAFELLRDAPNQSRYIEQLVLAYPPPPMSCVAEVVELIQYAHPFVVEPGLHVARKGLPTFGGDEPLPCKLGRPATWDDAVISNEYGTVYPRHQWESEVELERIADIGCQHE